jgi:hypothetical protein
MINHHQILGVGFLPVLLLLLWVLWQLLCFHVGGLLLEGQMVLVADDSSLHQAKDVELKGNKAGSSRQRSSLTRRQVTRLLLKTTVERSKPLCLYSRQERSCHTCYASLSVVRLGRV